MNEDDRLPHYEGPTPPAASEGPMPVIFSAVLAVGFALPLAKMLGHFES